MSAQLARAHAMAVFAVVAPIAYLAQRVIERIRSGPSDPVLILAENHAAFYWRASLATWWAAFGAFAFYLIARSSGSSLDFSSRIGALLFRARWSVVALLSLILIVWAWTHA